MPPILIGKLGYETYICNNGLVIKPVIKGGVLVCRIVKLVMEARDLHGRKRVDC
jgi:hypothetical protein